MNSLDKDRLNSFWNGITLASEDDAISFINKLTNPNLSNEERLQLCKAFKIIEDSILYTAGEGLEKLRIELEKRFLPQKFEPGAGVLKRFFHWFKNLY